MTQKIPISLPDAWDFFSDPAKLEAITPASMGFKIIDQLRAGKIDTGQKFEYRVKPMFSIPVHWISEITGVKEKEFFIDEQRKVPFRSWRHWHYFKEIAGGVEMTDQVEYQLPLWIFGGIAHTLFVKKKLRQLFEYRFTKTEELFGKWPGDQEMQIEASYEP